MSDKGQIQRRYYPNGQLESETQFRWEGGADWTIRTWHPNGVLASEVTVKNGVPEGVARYWDLNGELSGSYEMHNGTGVQKAWYPDGSLMSKISWVNGQRTGRQRSYFEDGELAVESYWVRGQQVSKKRYSSSLFGDASLPRYDEGTRPNKQKNSDHLAPVPGKNEEFFDSLLSASGTMEVLKWLKSGPGARVLGELASQEASIELAEELYAKGAVRVWAVEIDEDDPEMQNTGKLIVQLPTVRAKRSRVIAWCAKWARRNGYTPEPDLGQKHIFVMLD